MGKLRKAREAFVEAAKDRQVWGRMGLCALSGVLVALCFPPFDFGSLVWLALIPMLVVLWRLEGPRSHWRGAFYGGVAGIVTCSIQFWWFGVVAPAAGVLIPAYLSTYWIAFGMFTAQQDTGVKIQTPTGKSFEILS